MLVEARIRRDHHRGHRGLPCGAEGFERLVVLKRVHRHLTKDREFMGMLLDEARLASSIRHANVVPVIDVVRVEDEIISRHGLRGVVVALAAHAREAERTGKRLPIAVASRILYDVLMGLHEAHEAVDIRRQPLGIVHRDARPAEHRRRRRRRQRASSDFGILPRRGAASRGTRAGTIKGKCAYMAPEQVDGQPLDPQC